MFVITQNGESALMEAASEGRTEVVSLLLEAGANIDLQNKVHVGVHKSGLGGNVLIYNLNRVVCEVT